MTTSPMLPSSHPSHLSGFRPPLHPGFPAPLHRPSLAHQHAFDLCATEAQRAGTPVAVLASSPFYARELLKRLDGCDAVLVPVGQWSSWSADTDRWAGPEIQAPMMRSWAAGKFGAGTAVWAEPQVPDGQAISNRVYQLLPEGSQACVVVSGWLERFAAAEGNRRTQAGAPAAGLWRTSQWLKRAGFDTEGGYGFHGPAGLFWGRAGLLLERLGRPDWADRCGFRMRARFVTRGLPALCAPVGLLVVTKHAQRPRNSL